MPYRLNPITGKLDYYKVVGAGEIGSAELANGAIINAKLALEFQLPLVFFDHNENFFCDTKKRGHILTANGQAEQSVSPTIYYYAGFHRRFYFVYFEGRKDAAGNVRTGYENKTWINFFDIDSKTFGEQISLAELYPDSDDIHNLPLIVVANDGHILVCKEDLDYTGAPAVHNSHVEIWRSDNAEDISSFTKVATVGDDSTEKAYSYSNMFKLTNGTLFLVVRDKIAGEERYTSILKSTDHGLTWTDMNNMAQSRTIVNDYTTVGWFLYFRKVNAQKANGINIFLNPRHSTSSEGTKAVHFLHSDDGIIWENARQFVEGSGGYSHNVLTSGTMSKAVLDSNFGVDLSIINDLGVAIAAGRGCIDANNIPFLTAFKYNANSIPKVNKVTNLYLYYWDIATHAWITKDILPALDRSNDQYNFHLCYYHSMNFIAYGSGKIDLLLTIVVPYYDYITGETIQSSGALKQGLLYRIVLTAANHFGSGVVAGDLIRAGSAYTCDASNTVAPLRSIPVLFRSNDYGDSFHMISLENGFTKVGALGNLNMNYSYFDEDKLFLMYPVSGSTNNGTTLEFINIVSYLSQKA